MRTLRQSLLDADLVHLRAIARFWDVDLESARQRDAALELAEAMTTPEAVAHAWEALPDDQRQALKALLANDGQMPRRVFARQWGDVRAMGPGRMEREQAWREPISPAEGLWYRGWSFHSFEEGPDGLFEATFVPSELRAHLPKPDVPQPTIELDPHPAPAIVCSAGDAFLDDTCTSLAYLQNEHVRPTLDGTWPKRHKMRLLHRFRDSAPDRFELLRHLIEQIGWLRQSESGRLRPEPGPVTAWLRSSPGQQRRALVLAWRDDSTWNDLFHVPSLHPEDTGSWHNDPLLARSAVLHHLTACEPGAWYGISDLIAAIKQVDPDFQRPDGDYSDWYIRDAETGAYLSGFESWDAVEGALIRHLITGPLAWFSLVDLGLEASDFPPQAFCLTDAGAVFLDLTAPKPRPEMEPLRPRADFTVLVPVGRRYERFQLARVADWMHSGPSYVYRLTPDSLNRAKEQGIEVKRVLEFLEEVTEAPVPRSVEAALTRWEARGSEARLEQVVLLRLSSEALMDQIVSTPRFQRFVQERIGTTSALVRERDWPRIVAALGEMGLLPEITGLEDNKLDEE